jgi:hypothetical protein
MRSLTLLLLASPLTAAAAPLDWGLDGASAVDISATVDVPLYRGAATAWMPAIEATLPSAKADEPAISALMVVDLAGGWTQIAPDAASKLGLKSKKTNINGNDVELVIIPELNIGAMKLHNVKAVVKAPARLGVGTLPEIAAAILPSSGAVRFVPAANADALISEIGAAIPLSRIPAATYYEFGTKRAGNGVASFADGEVLGQKGKFFVRTDALTKVDEGVQIPGGHLVGGLPVAEDAPKLGGVALAPVVVQHNAAIADPKGEVVGTVGYDALFTSDIAYAPATNRLAIRGAATVQSKLAEDLLLTNARANFDAAEKKAAEKKGDDKPADAPKADTGDNGDPATTGRHTALAEALKSARQWPAAIAELEVATKTAGDHCEPWLALGAAYLVTGQPKAAVEPLTRAGTLWDRWYTQPLEGREAIQDGKKADLPFAIKQSPSCNSAWAKLATAQLALGQHDAVSQTYQAHRGSDPDVAFAYGLSLITSGKVAAADGPLREAIEQGGRSNAHVRSALSFANATSGGTAVANAQLDVLVGSINPSLAALLPHIEGLRASGGDAAALAGCKAAVAAAPWSSSAQLLLVRELKRAASGDLATAQARLDDMASREATWNAAQPSAQAKREAAKAIAGDVAAARAWFTTATADGADFWAAKAIAFEGSTDARDAVDAAVRTGLSALGSVKLGG